MKKLIAIFLPIFLFVSCSSTFELIAQNSNSIKMERDKTILVTTSENGYYQNTEYKNSGRKTTEVICKKLRPYASKVGSTPVKSFSSINPDVTIEYDYIIVPEIYHWEDRATNFSFMPDKMILGLTVYDNTGNMLNHIEIKGESTKVTYANNDPIELIDEALDIYIRQLFELH